MNSYTYITVAAGLIYRHGLFLANQRPDDKPFAGFWELPGGKVENGETPEEGLLRELAEELGIKVTSFKLLNVEEHTYKDSNLHAKIYFYAVSSFCGEPCPKENQNLRWIEPADLPEFDFLPADTNFLTRLQAEGFFCPASN